MNTVYSRLGVFGFCGILLVTPAAPIYGAEIASRTTQASVVQEDDAKLSAGNTLAPPPAVDASRNAVSPLSGALCERSQTGKNFRANILNGEWLRNLVAILNLLFVGYVFFITQRNRSKDQSDDRNKQLKAVEGFWYQKIIIEPNLPRVVDYFSCCRIRITDCKRNSVELSRNGGTISQLQTLLASANSELSGKKRDLVANLIHSLYVVDRDLAERCVGILDDAQDSISASLDQVTLDATGDKITAKLDELKLNLLRELFTSHLKTCGP